MVIVRLIGGLGNQMFQYAAARRIAYAGDSALKIDISWFQEEGVWTPRKYELGVYSLTAEIADPCEIKSLKSCRQNPLFRRLPAFLRSLISHTDRTHIIEKSHAFDPDILKVKGPLYLDGYWQSEKYFRDISEIIINEFSFKEELSEIDRHIAARIASSESVSIHIRRGDYVNLASANSFHGLCSLEYYRSAVDKISRQLDSPVFFIFSDDIEWVKENFNINFEIHFIDHNRPDEGYKDLRLMSLCKNHIIANSSFSWWGAWLCRNPRKIVYSPKRWFNNINAPDVIPDSWNRL